MHSLSESFKEDPDKSFILNYAPIFAELTPSQQGLITQKSKVIQYNKGDIVYRQHDSADAFYCLISGRVKIFTAEAGREQALEYLTCGKYFGIISLLTSEPHSVTAQAINDSKILRIAKEDFQALLSKIPNLAIDLSKTLSRRLRKKDLSEKKIFESNIISIFMVQESIKHFPIPLRKSFKVIAEGDFLGISPQANRTIYATNLSAGLKKEKHKNIILVDVSDEAKETHSVRELLLTEIGADRYPQLRLDTLQFPKDTVKEAIIQDLASGINLLTVRYNPKDSIYAESLNALLTYLTGDYHYIIVNLSVAMDEMVFQALNQS
ncbi:MAG: cyclic nucleotide-binding domain-containing protein, partial [Candidatus Omnitrophota bacterium]|nr:cyclic nucleotide-binding domain-containing protein [Candidatus Omnitrophota bacterium]